MSDYVHNKQVLYPLGEEEQAYLCNRYGVEDFYDLSWKATEIKSLFNHNNGFEIEVMDSGDCNYYLAYTLYSDYGEESGDFGRSRFLNESEQKKYKEIFEQILPVDSSKLKYADYCYYNCCEAPDYYLDDDFNEEI